MKKAIVLLWLLLLSQFNAAQASPVSVVFVGVTVIDVTGGPSKPGMTVIITGNRIAAIGKQGRVKIPGDALITNARGKFLIPGLWDMHVHTLMDGTSYEWAFALLVANGVTGVRDFGNTLPFERINQIRREVLEGKITGPRFGATTARIFEGKGSTLVPRVEVETPDEARRLVREYKRNGMDFIKPYNRLTREVYLAVIDEAKRQKIAVTGHVPFSMTAGEVSDLGQKSLEHFNDIFFSCSRDEDALRKELKRRLEAAKTGPVSAPYVLPEIIAVPTYDERKAKALAERLARNGTWWSPTIFISNTHPSERPREGDSRLKYIPKTMEERWRNAAKQRPEAVPSADERSLRDRRKFELVRLMHRAGVSLLAGTDIGNPYLYPGFSLHDELELFVKAGLTPLEALRTATVNPAKFLKKEKEFGTIEKGKLADLVLLDANPLENIGNTKRIYGVVVNGKYLSRESLEKMLSDAEAAVKQK